MILCIGNILDSAGIEAVRAAVAGGTYVDGVATAGWASRIVKKNEQLKPGPESQSAQRLVLDALRANQVFQAAAIPQRIGPPLFSRYTPGMAFGTHMDNAIMGEDNLRTDISVTVFLSAPEDYDGGELVMDLTGGEQAYKLDAGAAIVYPSTMLHRVNEVTRGAREVSVMWVQSLIRSAEKRELLFDLDRARRALFEREGKTLEFDLLSKTASNLRRMWVEP
jgi:PKHD-type hydroxylase